MSSSISAYSTSPSRRTSSCHTDVELFTLAVLGLQINVQKGLLPICSGMAFYICILKTLVYIHILHIYIIKSKLSDPR